MSLFYSVEPSELQPYLYVIRMYVDIISEDVLIADVITVPVERNESRQPGVNRTTSASDPTAQQQVRTLSESATQQVMVRLRRALTCRKRPIWLARPVYVSISILHVSGRSRNINNRVKNNKQRSGEQCEAAVRAAASSALPLACCELSRQSDALCHGLKRTLYWRPGGVKFRPTHSDAFLVLESFRMAACV